MASRYQDLLNIYTQADPNTNPGIFDTSSMPLTKQAQVNKAAMEKQAALDAEDGYALSAMRATGNGVQSATQQQQDYLKLSPFQFELKYGQDARVRMAAAEATGDSMRRNDTQDSRDATSIVGDSLNQAITGFGNSILGIGALGAGIVDKDAGVWAAQKLGQANDFMSGMRSRQANNAMRAYTVEQNLSERDNSKREAEISKEYGSVVGSIYKFGADSVDTVINGTRNPTIFADTVASGTGSLFSGGLVSKGLKAVGKATIGRVVSGKLAQAAAVAGEKAAMPAAIGLMEGGGAYQQTADQAYQALIAQGVPHEEAAQRANDAALEAAAIQAPIAALTGTLVSKFEGAPLRVPTLRGAAGNLVKETVEEGIQSATGQIAQNKGVQDYVDPNQSLMEGVGQQATLGALGGFGSAGVAQAPGVALRGAIETAKLPFRAAGAALTYAGNRVEARNQKIQDDALAGIFGAADEAMPEAQSEADRAIEAAKASATVKGAAREWVGDLVGKFQQTRGVQAAAEIVNKTGGAVRDKLTAAMDVLQAVRASEATQDSETPAPLADTAMQSIKDVVANAAQSEAVQSAMAKAKTLYGQVATKLNARAKTVTAPEDVQVAANDLVGLAETNPEKLDTEAAQKILFHAEQGTIQLTPVQTNALRVGIVQARTAQAQTDLGSKYGLADAQAVADQVLTDGRKDGQRLSLQEHLKGIRTALDSGNTEVAADALTELRGFAQHLSNQVVAINDALVGGNTNDKNPVVFKAHIGNGRFRDVGKRYIQPTSEKSVKVAQQMAVQASVVGTAFNNLSDAFPSFGLQHVEIPSLDASLDGDAATVSKEYASGKRKVPVNEADSAASVVEAGKVEQTEAPSDKQVVEEPNADQANSEQTVAEPTQKVEEPRSEPVVAEQEKVPAVEEKTSEEPAPAEPEQAPKDERVGGDTNRVSRAFREPEKTKIRVAENESPLQTIKDALSSESALRQHLGSDLNRSFDSKVAAGYTGLLATGERMLSSMTARMQAKLKDKLGRLSFEALLPKLESGALNAVVQDVDGNYVYDPKIAESAVLAGLQWVLSMNSHGTPLTDDDVRQAFGLASDAYIPEGLADNLSAGLSTAQAARSLADTIGRFMGLAERSDVPVNEAQAVKEGLAKEVLVALEEAGLIDRVEVDVSEISTIQNLDTNILFRPGAKVNEQGEKVRAIPADDPVRGFPNAIEKALLVEPTPDVASIGSAPTKVADTQLGSDTQIAEEQKEVIRAEQATEHRLNLPFVNMMQRMTEDLVLRLFADEVTDTLNENHKRSVEGRRLTFQSAYRSIQSLVTELENASKADPDGRAVDDLPVHYSYAYTVVNRLQMLGKDNPQSSKLMREAILPTWDVLDLTTPENRLKFSLGLAQALGVKVHQISQAQMLEELSKALAKFPKTLELLADGEAKLTPADIDTMKAEGVDSPVALHALMEYARLQKPETDRAKFKTALYFEADGVTNGVVNAMSLFSSGKFTGNWISNIQRGGLWIGEKALSLAGIRASSEDAGADLYGVAAENTAHNVRALISQNMNTDTGEVMQSVLHVLSVLLPKGIQYDEKNNKLAIDRGATKNPLTITVYGSGANGIAGNVLDEALGNMYERFSQAAARKKADPTISDGQAFFGGDKASADARWARFTKAMSLLGANTLGKDASTDTIYTKASGVSRVLSGSNFTDFTVDKLAKRSLQDNILHSFVNPMVDGITKTVGQDLIQTMDLIKTQTQAWSLVGQFMYQNAYQAKLAEKRAANPDMDPYELLTKAEENEIRKALGDNLPAFGTGTQNFTFGRQTRLNFPFMTSKKGNPLKLEFSRNLDDTMKTPAYGFMPGDAGVSGQPNMTIGSGDGQAVQNIVKNPDTPKRRLQIFDGIHSTVRELGQMGLAANKGVYDSWQRNPLADLAKAFDAFSKQVDLSTLNEEQQKALAKALSDEWTEIPSTEELEAGIKAYAQYGLQRADEVAARQRVLARVQLSVDQMAGAANPYISEGIILSGSPSEKAAQLNRLLAAEMVRQAPVEEIRGEVTPEPQTASKSFVAAPVGQLLKRTERAINKLTSDKLTRALLRDVIRSGRTSEYRITTGTREEILSLAAEQGITIPANRQAGFMGFTHTDSQQIFVVDGNPETVLHELIHAATYETVAAHYAGEDIGPDNKAAIARLEGLMKEFYEGDFVGNDYAAALAEMTRQQMNGNRAAELNEFMAWALSNPDLQTQLQDTKVENKALRIARNVVRAIKQLLWGGKRSAAVKDDLFSNIRFNTGIIMRADVTTNPASAALFHSPGFGENQRLSDLLASIKNKVGDYVDQGQIDRVVNSAKTKQSLANAARVLKAFNEAGFDMTKQQQMAFMHMAGIMGTAAELDANATARMQEMFSHVMSKLSVDDFLRNPEENNPADTEQATRKFNLLAGKFANRTDALDRSLILPAFVALAQTNDEFRDKIRQMELPKGKYVAWNSVDNVLDNLGDMAMDTVGRAVSGEGLRTKNVQESVDNLVAQMLETNADAELFIEKFTKPVGGFTDRVNDGLVSLFNWFGEKANANLERAKADPNAKIKLALAASLNTVAAMLHEPTGQQMAMNAMSAANQAENVWKPFYDLLKDLVGRTAENAGVYDLIKIARFHVSSLRQQFVEELPKIINGKFKTTPTAEHQEAMHRGIAQTDLASMLVDNSVEDILKWMSNPAARDVKAKQLMDQIRELSPENAALIEQKADQLADWMVNKKTSANLLRNADAIAHLLNEGKPSLVTTKEMVSAIDQLVSLKALAKQTSKTQIALSSLVLSEKEGLNFVLNSLRGQREVETAKANGNGRFNHYKGHMTASPADSMSLVVAHDNETAKMLAKSYIRLGPLVGSDKDPSAKNRSYWLAPVSGRAGYSQGIVQNVQQTVSGVDLSTGFTLGTTGGVITDPKFVAQIQKNQKAEAYGSALLPVFDAKGKLYAYERQVDPAMTDRLQPDMDLAKMMGVRGGRQAEEAAAMTINKLLVDNLRDMWDRDRRAGRKAEYVDLFKSDDAVVKDSVGIFSNEMRAYVEARFPEGFMVRKDMIDDAIGYRAASIGDAWTGTSRWSPETQELVKKTLMGMFGNKAYAHAVRAERFWQNAIVQDIRTMIVIRSVIVPMANAASNVYQLISRGVPVVPIFRGIPKKTAEIEAWHKTRIRQMEAEAELLATTDPIQQQKLRAEIKTITDSHKRLSIWPLLERGEFSSISDAGSREDVLLTEGKLSDFVEAQIDKLPSAVRTAGKYAIISKDTALFRALQKTVDYGDFVAKAILYDDLTKRKGLSSDDALSKITEEFVNYDRLPGRDRQYLESVGLLWFWNFKVRSAKIALSMIRNNPAHALIAANLPVPMNGIGLPLEDNLWATLFDGRLFNSFGLHMGFRAPGLLPLGGLLG